MLLHVFAQATSAGDGGTGWAQILLSVVGPAGLIGALVALLKLKPEASSAAVLDAQGASAEWKSIADDRKTEIAELELAIKTQRAEFEQVIKELRDELDKWKLRAEANLAGRKRPSS